MQFIYSLVVALAVVQLSLARSVLLRRQQEVIDPSEIPSACQSICASPLNLINTCTDDSCLCTNSFGPSYEACISCILNIGSSPSVAEEEQFQNWIDEIIQECDSEGFSVSSVALSSASPLSSGAASISAGANIPVASANATGSGSAVQTVSAPGPTTTGSGSGGSSGAVSVGAASFAWTAMAAAGFAVLALGL